MQQGRAIQYGKIKEEIKALKIDQIVLKESPLTYVATLFAGKEGSPAVIFHAYENNIPKVSLNMQNASFLDIMEEACSQVEYVFWIENFVIYMVPKSKLPEHKNPRRTIKFGTLKTKE